MSEAYEAVEAAMKDVDTLRRGLKKKTTKKVRSSEELALIKAVCHTWFKNHRPKVFACIEDDLLSDVDSHFTTMLSGTDRETARTLYDRNLKSVKAKLSDLREYTITSIQEEVHSTADTPPSFMKLIPDPAMQKILESRWNECAKCVLADAPLSATVMMGGFLEALLLARVNRETNKTSVFNATKSPKDKKTGKTKPLQEWSLRHYIDVAHELSWISSSAKDVGEVVRDYRNYIHPYKELSHGVILSSGDAKLFWEIAKSIARQLLI
ncbi:MAG: hypothetical protein NXI29_14335 [bacterium]|nr:hypothetical protein [bacterium]